MAYLLVSVPTDGSPKNTKSKLQAAVDKYSSQVTNFKIPQLKIGTLDQLMKLSDVLQTVDVQGEQVVKKIERSFYDMLAQNPKNEEKNIQNGNKKQKEKDTKHKTVVLRVGLSHSNNRKGNKPETVNLLPHEYIKSFKWDRLYEHTKPIQTLADDMSKIISKADEDLKNQMTNYSDYKGALEVIERKETGSLMVKPLGEFVRRKDMVISEHLTTLMVVIPRNREEWFLQNYELLEKFQKQLKKQQATKSETPVEEEMEKVEEIKSAIPENETQKERLEREADEEAAREELKKRKEERERQAKLDKLNALCENVVPGSAKSLVAEDDFVLYRIVIFKKGEENIKKLLRQERFTVRQFKYDPEEVSAAKRRKKGLQEKRNKAWNAVLKWCKVYFERIFKMWIHVKALRCFVETILRYGLPPNFQAYLIEIKPKQLEKLRASLKRLYANLDSSLADEDTSQDTIVTSGMAGLSDDFYPYVSLDLNLQND